MRNQITIFTCVFVLAVSLTVGSAMSAEEWRVEFDAISSQSMVSMSLSVEELKTLVERCEKLSSALEALDESSRKVYSRRLKKTKGLFEYVIMSKEAETKK